MNTIPSGKREYMGETFELEALREELSNVLREIIRKMTISLVDQSLSDVLGAPSSGDGERGKNEQSRVFREISTKPLNSGGSDASICTGFDLR
jgi:hypothetical protein